jgi:type II secretory pathway predicted ATPase ExeA
VYTEHFGFREHPFRITPDPRFFYPNPGHQEAYASLVYGITQRRGFVVLTGEVGTGKTTLLRRLMKELVDSAHFAFVYNTTWTFDEVLDAVCQDFDLRTGKNFRQFDKIQALNAFLLTQFTQGRTAALLIDEAHNLEVDVIENLRLLSNLETGSEKLLQIVLVGQSELGEKLTQPSLRSLRDRIAIWGRLDRLKERDVGPFILHRLQTAGYSGHGLFTSEAIERIARYSQGSPRRINIICDNALLTAYGTYQTQISDRIIEEVAQDLALCDGSASVNQGVDVALVSTTTPTEATRPFVQVNNEPDSDASMLDHHEAIRRQERVSGDEKLVHSWSRWLTPTRIAALALLLLCLSSLLLLRLSGKNNEMIEDATTSLSTLLREWLSPLGLQVEAKSLERAPLSEQYRETPERGLEKNKDNVKSITQEFPLQSTEQAPPPQSTRTQESNDNRAFVTATSPVGPGVKDLARQMIQEQQRDQLVTVPSGVTIVELVSQIYGKKNLLGLDIVREYNPHVNNFDRVSAGERLWMPALNRDTLIRQQADGSYHLIVASFRKRKEANRWVHTVLGSRYPAAILKQEISMTRRLYRVVIEGLRDRAAIERAWQLLNSQESVAGATNPDKKGADSNAIQLQASPLS